MFRDVHMCIDICVDMCIDMDRGSSLTVRLCIDTCICISCTYPDINSCLLTNSCAHICF